MSADIATHDVGITYIMGHDDITGTLALHHVGRWPGMRIAT